MRARLRVVLALATCVTALHASAQQDDWRTQYVEVDAPTVMLTNARIIDGFDGSVRDRQSILIEEGKIKALGTSIVVPASARVLDLRGRTVLPGLVMLHEHMMYFSGRAVWHAQPVSYPKLYLAAGVTTLRTGGAEHPEVDRNLKRRIDEGHAPGPKMILTGPYFNGAAGDFLGDTIVSNPEQARTAVAYWASRGFGTLKLYDAMDRPTAKLIIDEAHARGIKVTAHLGKMGCMEAAELGIDFIEHAFASCHRDLGTTPDGRGFRADPNDPKVRALIRALLAAKVVLVSTPSKLDQPLSAEELDMLSPQARERYLADAKNPPPWAPDIMGLKQLRRLEREYVAQGGKLGVGADPMDFGQMAGYANHRALVALVEDGWTPAETIRLATSNNAQLLGIGDRVGRIAPGYAADLLIIDGDPLNDIRDIANVELVFKDGVGYDPVKLRNAAKGLVGWH